MPAPRSPTTLRSRHAAALLAAALLVVPLTTGCAGAGAASGGVGAAVPAGAGADPAGEARPLAALARGGALVLPVQRLELAGGVAAPPGGSDAFLRALDAELAFALGERLGGSTVAGADVAERMARSNPTYAGDPRALPLPAGRALEAGAEVKEPLSSQLRAVAALADRRHAVVPLLLRVEPDTGGTARAVLRLALVDVRLARVLWSGSTAAAVGAHPSAALAPRVAARFADLFAAPPEP